MISSPADRVDLLDRTHRAALLERICSSAELRRAARLRDFLRYVGQRSLEEDHVQVSEQEIGVHVFGRSAEYDTGIDNIVRVNASELRKRIAAYFAAEGIHEPILLEIPRGSYTPQFRLRPAEAEPETSVANHTPALSISGASISGPGQTSPALVPAAISSAPRYPLIAALAALVVAVAVCLYLFQDDHAMNKALYGWQGKPVVGSFWSGMLESSRQTDVVLADTSFALIEDVLGKRISLNDYLTRRYVQQIQDSNLSPELKNDLQIIASRSNGSLGDFRVAERILRFDPRSTRINLQFARDYRPGAITSDNVILIGSSRSNPWCGLFEDRLNFTIDYDPNLHEMLVRNRHPQNRESGVYVSPVDPNGSNGYSVIDFIPNQNNSADVLIIAGTTSEATEAAGDFLTSEDSLRRFQESLHLRRLPYFELLLKTTKLIGTPLSAEVIAYRTLPGHPLDKQ